MQHTRRLSRPTFTKSGATISDDDGKELARNQLGIEGGISGIEAQDRGPRELRRCGDHDDIVGADAPDDGRAELLVSASEHESLRTDRAEDQLASRIPVEQIEDLPLVEVLPDDPTVGEGIDPQQRLVDAERSTHRLHRASRSKQEQTVRIGFDLLA